jgi:hypothetical protein
MLTRLDHLEKLVTLTGKNGPTDSYFEKADEHVEAVSAKTLVSYCRDELINETETGRKIGFTA